MILNEYLAVRSIEPRTLENIKDLYGLLGNPQQSMVCIQVAGTNAKGSIASMLANILRSAGYRTGLFTSPALLRPNERIVIDGSEIDDALFLSCAEKVSEAENRLGRSFGGFDRVTACALLAFQAYGVDFAVLETGLGGRLDPVTAVDTKLSILASISMDHMELLGDTLAKIAMEKCGIMKRGVPVISYPQQPEAAEIVRSQAASCGCPLTFVNAADVAERIITERNQSFRYKGNRIRLSMIGVHQQLNAATAWEAAVKLRELGYAVPDSAIFEGLEKTRWPGRLEWIDGVLLDGAHNPDAMRTLRMSLNDFYPGRRPVILISVMRDKDVAGILKELALFAKEAITVQIAPRAFEAIELANILEQAGIPAAPSPSVKAGLAELKEKARLRRDNLPLIAGSLYLVGGVRELLLQNH